jgi:AraC-like DNA-binding protein
MPEPQLPRPMGDRKNCYPLRTTGCRSFEPCGIQRKIQLRYSKQPGKSSALRSNSNSAKERPIVGLSERVYESTKLAALFDVLVDQGCPAGEILRNVNLTVDEVHSPKSRISLAELMAACKNAIRLSSDPHLPYRIGTSIHISAYGMYGFAILCCPDFRKAMAFAELYHALAAPLATIEFTEQDGVASWLIEPNARAAADPQIYRFITEMQIGIHISLMRDIMGAAFNPDQISLAYPEAHDFGLAADRIGCRLSFASRTNQILFRSAWLDQAANLGNKTTYPAVVALCDNLLNELKSRIGIAGEIRALLLRNIANPPTLTAIAKLLEVSDRSLRRQLGEQGISFRGLLDELRMQIALKYLRTTRLANEDIALALGFSDAANFRRAFRRWTSKSPSEIRTK